MEEYEVELRRRDWVVKVRGSRHEVVSSGRNLSGILDELLGESVEVEFAQRPDSLTLVAQNISEVGLSEAVLLAFILHNNKPMTKEDLAGKLKQLGKAFSVSTLEYKTVPSMCRDGLLNFAEIRAEGIRGQVPRTYFLSERGKIEAERKKNELSDSKGN